MFSCEIWFWNKNGISGITRIGEAIWSRGKRGNISIWGAATSTEYRDAHYRDCPTIVSIAALGRSLHSTCRFFLFGSATIQSLAAQYDALAKISLIRLIRRYRFEYEKWSVSNKYILHVNVCLLRSIERSANLFECQPNRTVWMKNEPGAMRDTFSAAPTAFYRSNIQCDPVHISILMLAVFAPSPGRSLRKFQYYWNFIFL